MSALEVAAEGLLGEPKGRNRIPRRVAIYCQCVAAREKRTVLERLRAVAKQEGWIISGEFAERHGKSGPGPRPEWRRLQRLIEAGKVDVVVVPSLDAIGEGVSDLLAEIVWLQNLRCDLYVHDVGLNTLSPVDRVLFKVVEAIKAVDDASAPAVQVSARRRRSRLRPPELTPYQRSVIHSAISSGMSPGEVAKSLKLPVASVREVAKSEKP